MIDLKSLTRAVGLGLCVVAFTGTALADPGTGNGNGPAVTPPGQEQKAETAAASAPAGTPAPPAAQGQAQKAENQAKRDAKKAAAKPAGKSAAAKAAAPGQAKKAEKQAAKSAKSAAKSAKAATPSKGQSADAHHHVIVCHATGSDSNPYVVINIPWTAWTHGHSKHGDRLLKDPASRPGSKDGFDKSACETSPTPNATATSQTLSGQQSTATACPATTRTVTEVVPGYVLHKTGSKTNPYVTIRPSEHSAHHDRAKHPDDVIVPAQTVTRTITEPGTCTQSSSTNAVTTTTTTFQLETLTTTTLAGQSIVVPAQTVTVGQALARQPVAAAGVAGAVSPTLHGKAKPKGAGGVLGAIASAPAAVAETATSGTLPFTGIPLWIAALIGGALLATGLVLRRAA